jgi:hypothetical protein
MGVFDFAYFARGLLLQLEVHAAVYVVDAFG